MRELQLLARKAEIEAEIANIFGPVSPDQVAELDAIDAEIDALKRRQGFQKGLVVGGLAVGALMMFLR